MAPLLCMMMRILQRRRVLILLVKKEELEISVLFFLSLCLTPVFGGSVMSQPSTRMTLSFSVALVHPNPSVILTPLSIRTIKKAENKKTVSTRRVEWMLLSLLLF